jgi:hypothetical protein
MNKQRLTRLLGTLLLVAGLCHHALARSKQPVVPLTEEGQKIFKAYTEMQDSLKAEISAALPTLDQQKKATFLADRATLGKITAPGEEATVAQRVQYTKMKALAESQMLLSSRAILTNAKKFLASDKLDAKIIKAAILRHGTPRALAEFAQQSPQHKALLDKLFADEALMKQLLIAGGANGGDYGEMMQVYTAILAASEKARQPGILQRLALGTAIQMPWIPGKDKGTVPAAVYRTQTKIDQVPRFLHYEKAYFNKELDPDFKDMTTWECRFITNSEYTNKDLTWMRTMMRNFRPDHITQKDHKWRYTRLVKSDVPYTSTTHDPTIGSKAQEQICLGGICGRRAFIGRLTTRAFGIPTRASTQTGHAAMSRWTPDGWVINLGAWWSNAWCGPQGGLDFYLDSQARELPIQYMQALRAQWIGSALGEEDVSIRQYGQGGGFWDGLAFYKKRVLVEDAMKDKVKSELEGLSAKEGQLLGESNQVLGDGDVKPIVIPEADRTAVIAKDGTIFVPAASCSKPNNNTEKVKFQNSFGGGMQLHYQGVGIRPEILRYTVEAPAAGKYEISLNVCTVSRKYEVIARLNRRTIVNIMLPYTKGTWDRTKPEVVELRKGRNTFMFTFRAPNRGVSLKDFKLTPVK